MGSPVVRRGGSALDENVTEELAFHQETVASDTNTPLHLIREKEIEISGRVLAAKRQADEIVADARKQAASLLGSVQEEAAANAGAREAEVRAEVDRDIAQLHVQSEGEVAALAGSIEKRLPEAVAMVIGSVTRV